MTINGRQLRTGHSSKMGIIHADMHEYHISQSLIYNMQVCNVLKIFCNVYRIVMLSYAMFHDSCHVISCHVMCLYTPFTLQELQ